MAVLPVGISGAQPSGYQIERSLRFNSADSAYLNRTPGSAGNRKTWTWSAWVKRGRLGVEETLFACGTSASDTAFGQLIFGSDNSFRVNAYFTSWLYTTQQFRDLSAWYHFVVAFDTTQATGSDRVKLYVNGVRVTAFAISNNPSQNTDYAINQAVQHTIGRQDVGPGGYLSAYQADINFIDGQALTPSSFGETDTTTGVWKPKAYSGSYGTNGFYLNFSDNSGTTSTTLGKDRAGSNNWTPNNFSVTAGAGNDSLVDTPTPYGTDTGAGGQVRGNYCTWNALGDGATVSNGNLDATSAGAYYRGRLATMASPSGKFYFEARINGVSTGNNLGVGIGSSDTTLVGRDGASDVDFMYLDATNSSGSLNYSIYGNGNTYTAASLGGSAVGDIMMVAYDYDTGKLWLGANNTWYNSGNPAAGTNPTATMTNPLDKFFYVVAYSTTSSCSANFGQRPFAYTAPSGFKALVTTNLPTPTVVQGDDYFNTVLYTGNGSTQSITGVGFQPDWVWIKRRSGSVQSHNLTDAVRGTNKSLTTNGADAEQNPSLYGQVSAFNSDGFTVASGTSGIGEVNGTSETYAAWNWKANGAGSSNTAGSITSTVSVSTTSGFSIVSYTGTGSAATVGHGLGVAPKVIITKSRSAANGWGVYHASVGATAGLFLETTDAAFTSSDYWNNTAPTSSVFSIEDSVRTNQSSTTYIAYCFAEIEGFSKFGSYTGNGSTDGPFVYLGFRPAFVISKRSGNSGFWVVLDDMRPGYNVTNQVVYANSANAQSTAQATDFLSNGFKPRTTDSDVNSSGGTHIYMAFAENPFKYSLAR